MADHTFDSILAALAAQHQRATYSAVAGVVNTTPRALMQGRPRDPYHSWIVNKRTGQPTGYPEGRVAPELAENPEVLASGEELLAWLGQRQQGVIGEEATPTGSDSTPMNGEPGHSGRALPEIP